MPDFFLDYTQARAANGSLDLGLTDRRREIAETLPSRLVSSFVETVNHFRRELDPYCQLYTSGDLMIAVPSTPRSYRSHNSPGLELASLMDPRLNAGHLRAALYEATLKQLSHDERLALGSLDIIVRADGTAGCSMNFATGELAEWNDHDGV